MTGLHSLAPSWVDDPSCQSLPWKGNTDHVGEELDERQSRAFSLAVGSPWYLFRMAKRGGKRYSYKLPGTVYSEYVATQSRVTVIITLKPGAVVGLRIIIQEI